MEKKCKKCGAENGEIVMVDSAKGNCTHDFSPDLTLEQRVARIEKWVDFWETVETPWDVIK